MTHWTLTYHLIGLTAFLLLAVACSAVQPAPTPAPTLPPSAVPLLAASPTVLPKTDTSSKPSNRTFISTDLSRLVLQQSESALPLQESGDSLGDMPWSEMVSQWRAVGVQAASFRIYKDSQQQYIASSAILFSDLAGATQGFQIDADFTRKSQTLTPLSGLGDEGLGFVVQRPDGTIVGYTWRVNNVLLELIVGGKDIDEEHARTLADKMQSHTK